MGTEGQDPLQPCPALPQPVPGQERLNTRSVQQGLTLRPPLSTAGVRVRAQHQGLLSLMSRTGQPEGYEPKDTTLRCSVTLLCWRKAMHCPGPYPCEGFSSNQTETIAGGTSVVPTARICDSFTHAPELTEPVWQRR